MTHTCTQKKSSLYLPVLSLQRIFWFIGSDKRECGWGTAAPAPCPELVTQAALEKWSSVRAKHDGKDGFLYLLRKTQPLLHIKPLVHSSSPDKCKGEGGPTLSPGCPAQPHLSHPILSPHLALPEAGMQEGQVRGKWILRKKNKQIKKAHK